MGLLSYIIRAGLVASLGSVIVASCGGTEFTSSDVATGGGGGSGNGGGSGSGGGAGSSEAGSGGAEAGSGPGGSMSVDASLPAQCSADVDCDDKNVCTGKELCRDGKCIAVTAMACAVSNNPCTTTRCDPLLGCVTANNNADCNDGNLCTTGDKCSAGTCQPGSPKSCPVSQPCDPQTGLCKCPGNTLACGSTCVNTACCPGALSGPCGRCGTWKCNAQGTALDCMGQHGNCDPGWTCTGMCTCPDGGDCSCPTGQHRQCDATCNRTACL